MGFFSFNCKECGLTVLNHSYAAPLNQLADIVIIDYKDKVHMGSYDGYGRLDGVDMLQDGRDGTVTWEDMYEKYRPAVYHDSCYSNMEEVPTSYPGASEHCEFQGWFIEPEDVINLIHSNEKFMMNLSSMEKDFQEFLVSAEVVGLEN